jgi:murein DD-endopeptidase MepM/ murein hydrolase activator NlpD
MIWKVLRRICEHKRARQVLGVNLLSAFVLLAQVNSPTFASLNQEKELIILPAATTSLLTQTSFQKPLATLRLTQGFHFLHPAVDLAAPKGTSTRPIKEGLVEEESFSRFAYGNSLIIDHGSGLKSHYAHLAKILVKKGQEVNRETVLGEVGSTGFSTGPHLHLEITANGQFLNPRTILGL